MRLIYGCGLYTDVYGTIYKSVHKSLRLSQRDIKLAEGCDWMQVVITSVSVQYISTVKPGLSRLERTGLNCQGNQKYGY